MQISDSLYTDLLDDVKNKNFVRVTHYKAVSKPFAPRRYKTVMDEVSNEGAAQLPALFLHDSLRMLSGKKPLYIPELTARLGGELVSVSPNLRTNVGIDFCATQLGSTAPTTQADYIGLSNNTITPAATDTSNVAPWNTAQAADAAPSTSTGEYTGVGLTRKQATYAHTTSATNYTMAATWTATGAITSVRLAGLFGGSARTVQSTSANNILFLENTFTSTTLANADQLSLTWTVNI